MSNITCPFTTAHLPTLPTPCLHAVGRHCLSDATPLIAASFALCVVRRAKDHHILLHYPPPEKPNRCVRQVVLDKRFPLNVIS